MQSRRGVDSSAAQWVQTLVCRAARPLVTETRMRAPTVGVIVDERNPCCL